MARAKSERARSKTLAIDDLTQSIEQLRAFIPKLEDLGREGFPYLEGAQTRTELQLRECIKRAFGEKSSEFQSHHHLKLSVSSAAEKKQTLALIRGFIASLEEKKLELQGLKPATGQQPDASSNSPQMTAVPPTVGTAPASVTSVATTGVTLHLVPKVEAASLAPAAAPMPEPSPATPSVAESTPPAVSPPARSPSPRAPIEPISSLFCTQETKPSAVTAQDPSPAGSAPVQATVPPPTSSLPAVTPTASAPSAAGVTSDMAAPQAFAPQASAPPTLSSTQEVPMTPPASTSQSAVSVSTPPLSPPVDNGTEDLAISKRLCQRFHAVARQLRLRGEYRSTLTVEDEQDVQDLMHVLLRQHFDDIGTDEWTPTYTDGASRTTFLLDHDRLAIVVKKTRTGLSRKDLGDQVRADVERYGARGRCTHLLCFIYDPEGRVGNPRGLESELSSKSEHFTVEVLVAPK